MVGMAPTSENVTRINNKTINNQRSKEFAIDELMHGDEQHSKVIKLQTFIANSQDVCIYYALYLIYCYIIM